MVFVGVVRLIFCSDRVFNSARYVTVVDFVLLGFGDFYIIRIEVAVVEVKSILGK